MRRLHPDDVVAHWRTRMRQVCGDSNSDHTVIINSASGAQVWHGIIKGHAQRADALLIVATHARRTPTDPPVVMTVVSVNIMVRHAVCHWCPSRREVPQVMAWLKRTLQTQDDPRDCVHEVVVNAANNAVLWRGTFDTLDDVPLVLDYVNTGLTNAATRFPLWVTVQRRAADAAVCAA